MRHSIHVSDELSRLGFEPIPGTFASWNEAFELGVREFGTAYFGIGGWLVEEVGVDA